MTIRKRLDRLESKHGDYSGGPSVIFICDAETGEPRAGLVIGGENLAREDGETPEAFEVRAMAGANGAILLPDNAR